MQLRSAAAILVLVLAPVPAVAADDLMAFPDACRVKTAPSDHVTAGHAAGPGSKGPSMGAMPGMAGHGPALKDHQQAAMAGMTTMDADMAAGMQQDDADVAFICGMIAHHQGAIAMSEVELKFGKDAFAKQMATTVIAAQKQEIVAMKDWVAKTVKK